MRSTMFAVAFLLVGCAPPPPIPPAPAPAREATMVAAGFDATWNAVIDHFAAATIPIATIDRASGLIATSRLAVGSLSDAVAFADCGSPPPTAYTREPVPYPATSVIYNVLVRGDERAATVRVTAAWEPGALSPFDCETKGVWERQVEAAVKSRAEG